MAIYACLFLSGCVFLFEGPDGHRLTGRKAQRFYGTFLRSEPDGSQSILHIYPNAAGKVWFVCLGGVYPDPGRCEAVQAGCGEASLLGIGKETYLDLELGFGSVDGNAFPVLHVIAKLEANQDGGLGIAGWNEEYLQEAMASGQLLGTAKKGRFLGAKWVTIFITSNSRQVAAFLASNAANPKLWQPPLTYERASVQYVRGNGGPIDDQLIP